MSYRWPEETDFALRELDVLDRHGPGNGVLHPEYLNHRSDSTGTINQSILTLKILDLLRRAGSRCWTE